MSTKFVSDGEVMRAHDDSHREFERKISEERIRGALESWKNVMYRVRKERRMRRGKEDQTIPESVHERTPEENYRSMATFIKHKIMTENRSKDPYYYDPRFNDPRTLQSKREELEKEARRMFDEWLSKKQSEPRQVSGGG